MTRTAVSSLTAALCAALALSCAEAPAPSPEKPAVEVQYEDAAKPKAPEAPKLDLSYWEKKTDLFKAPPPPVPAELKLPPVERWKLKNGLEIVVVARHDLPVASFSLAIKSGSYDEDKDHLGVASFTASMLRKGTKKRKADDISKAIDFVGGSLGAAGGSESSSADCNSLSKDTGLCLDLLSDIVLNPTFPEEEMKEIADQMVAALQSRYDDPGTLAREHFTNLIFGDKHPDGRVMNPEDVAKIKRDDLVEFWKTFYRPNNAMLAVAGDVNVAALKKDLEKAFGSWSRGEIPKRTMPPIPERRGTQILLIDKPDLTQSTVMFGHKGIKHSDPAFYAVTMMNYVLGGSDFSSRLTRIVRAEKGLTYGIGSGFGASLYEGAFRVGTSTKTESTWQALVAAIDEVRRMKKEGPTEEELAKGKGFYAGSYPFRLQTAEGIAGSIVAAELHDLDAKYVREYPVRLAKVDVAAAKAAAAKYLDPDHVAIVIIGNAEAIAKQIDPQLKYERINFKDPISYGVRKAARMKAAQAVASGEGNKALELVQKAIAAHGGEKAMRAIKDVTVNLAGLQKVGEEEADITVTMNSAPGKMRYAQEVMTPRGTSKIEFLVTPAGVKGGQGGDLKPLNPRGPYHGLARAMQFEDPAFLLLAIADGKPAMQLAPDVTDAGRKLVGVSFKSPGGDPITVYFDAATGLLARVKSRGQSGDKTVDYSDFRPVSGVKMAHKWVEKDGPAVEDKAVKEIKVNSLDAKVFQ